MFVLSGACLLMVSFGEATCRHGETQDRTGPDTRRVPPALEHTVPARGSPRSCLCRGRAEGVSGSPECAPQPCQPISPGGVGGSSTKRPPQLGRGSLLGCTSCDTEQGHCWPCGTRCPVCSPGVSCVSCCGVLLVLGAVLWVPWGATAQQPGSSAPLRSQTMQRAARFPIGTC